MVEQGAERAVVPDALGGPLGAVLRERRAEVLAITARHGLTNVRVFGSVARGDDGPDSDVDLLADFPSGIGLFGFGRAIHDLEDLLRVRVDLVPAGDLKPGVRDEVEAQALPL